MAEEIVDGALGFSSEGFGLRPFMFDGVKIGGIGGEIEERVSGPSDGILYQQPDDLTRFRDFNFVGNMIVCLLC